MKLNSSKNSPNRHFAGLRVWVSAALAVVLLTGMTGGLVTEVPTQRLYGLVTTSFGIAGVDRKRCSGFIYKQWVVTAGHCQGNTPLLISMFKGGSTQELPYIGLGSSANDAFIKHLFVGPSSPGGGVMLIKFPKPFQDRRVDVVPRAVLPTAATRKVKVGDKVLCFGRGDIKDSPNGDPANATDSDGRYRSAEFTVLEDRDDGTIKLGYDEFSFKGGILTKAMAGDSGGPCFATTPDGTSPDNFVAVAMIMSSLTTPPRNEGDPNALWTFHGFFALKLAPYADSIVAITGR